MIKTSLPREILGAIREMLQMAWGSLFESLSLGKTKRLLIRGGMTSVALAAAAIVKSHGAVVASTTRFRVPLARERPIFHDALISIGGRALRI